MKIDSKHWHVCSICNKDIKSISKENGMSGSYYTEVFAQHLKDDHKISPEEYFEKISFRNTCGCGECGKPVDLTWRGKGYFKWKKYKCGRNNGVKKWSEWAKEGRKSKNNPMYGKTPWNKNQTKITSESLMSVSQKMTGREVSKETRNKQSISAKNRDKHGHYGHKHSEESKAKMRISTLNQIKNGKFPQTKTKPHLEMANILRSMNIEFQEEYVIKYWSFDFFLLDLDILIEVDGDYFHSNPKFYKEPKTKTQKMNAYRDMKKNEFCLQNGYNLIRIWEDEILNNRKEVICRLKTLLA